MSLSQELTNRGFVHQTTSEDLTEIVDGPKRTIYHGIDPTADSAHAGNFVSWILLKHLANAGHKIVFLVGGGTGMIGDPKPDVERPLLKKEEVDARVSKLKQQAEKLFGESVTFVNNYDWLGKLELITFLRDIGKHFTVNELLKKDAIATRLGSEIGISYTEFAYPLLQAYDYLELYRQHECDVQVGGSDQWGNMVAGVDLIRRIEKATVYAITVPLIVDKTTGKKFGKSEGNAVWLDAEKTSPYQFYQFWLNTADENVIDYLKIFTFIPLVEIDNIAKKFAENPGSRLAQKTLARAVTAFVHGEEQTTLVERVSTILFEGGSLTELGSGGKTMLLENAPTTKISEGQSLVDVLVASELATSKREARTFIESGAITINGEKITDVDAVVTTKQLTGGIALLKRGKRQISVLVL